jgi:subtilisin-like proprotein convertase family protein
MNDVVGSHGIVASNNSWGLRMGWYWTGAGWASATDPSYFGSYVASLSGSLDQLMVDNPELLVLFAAGNDRWEGPAGQEDGTLAPDGELYDLVDPYGSAKNVLVVGALEDDGVTPTGFTSFGPADDGRIKPEVMANGAGLRSTQPNDQYASYSGTSMACPSASGAVATLVQLYRNLTGGNPRAELLRALLATTAADLHLPGPDARTGFGRLSARRAAEVMLLDAAPTLTHVLAGTVTDSQVVEQSFSVPVGTARLHLTLGWIDLPGSSMSTVALINDLDLALVEPGTGTVHHPWGLDPLNPHLAATRGPNQVDNLEQVTVDQPVAGTWRLRITGASVTGSQTYAVVSLTNLGLDPGRRLVSGRIAECGVGVADQLVRLTGDLDDEVLTDAQGYYCFQVPDGAYTVEPQGSSTDPAARGTQVSGGDVLDLDFTVQPAGAGTCQYLRDESPGLSIPDDDPVGVTSTLSVPDSFSITNLLVRVQITHTFRGDLQVELRAPGGSPSARLRIPDGGDSAANVQGTFDTELTPVDSLGVFDGVDPMGVWELAVSDHFAIDTGTLDEWELTLGCAAGSPPDITTTTLPAASDGAAYAASLGTAPGTPPYTWDVAAGSLPPGISLTVPGDLTGTPAGHGSWTFTVRVVDDAGFCDTQELVLAVAPSSPTGSGVCGDCDNSSLVNILDSLQAARIDSGLAQLVPGAGDQCDVSGGAGVSILDSLQIARYVVGQVPTLSCIP